MRQKELSEPTLHSSFNLAEVLDGTYWRDDEGNVYFCEVFPASVTFTNAGTHKLEASTEMDIIILNDESDYLTVLGFKSLKKIQI